MGLQVAAAGKIINEFTGLAFAGGEFETDNPAIRFVSAEAWTRDAQGAHITFATAPIGTSSPVEGMRLTSEGILLVGTDTASGSAKLQVSGAISVSGITYAGTLALSATGANVITLSTNGSEALRVSSDQKVGIGGSPAAKLDVIGALSQVYSTLRVEQRATAAGAYGVEIHTYADNGASPTPNTGAQTGLMVHNYSDLGPAMQVDQTRSKPILVLKNSENASTSNGTRGSGAFINFVGYGASAPTSVADLGLIASDLQVYSYDPLNKWTFATGLDVKTGLKSTITTATSPSASGTSTTENVLRLGATSTAVVLDLGVSNSPAYSWMQSRAYTTYSTNYALAFNPNGGNILVGTTTDGNYKLDVAASGASGTLRVYDQTATTGSTSLVVQAGAGQSTNALVNITANDGTTSVFKVLDTKIGFFNATPVVKQTVTADAASILAALQAYGLAV